MESAYTFLLSIRLCRILGNADAEDFGSRCSEAIEKIAQGDEFLLNELQKGETYSNKVALVHRQTASKIAEQLQSFECAS